MNQGWRLHDRNQLLWPAAGIVLGALAGANPFYSPEVTLPIGIAAWLVDLVLVLVLSLHPGTLRLGVLVAGLFLAVITLASPGFVEPRYRLWTLVGAHPMRC